MRKKTRNRIIVYLTLAAAALPFVSELAQRREEEALKPLADSLTYVSLRMDNDPMANHQADLLERMKHALIKQEFIAENKSNLGLFLSFVSMACVLGLGYFGLKEEKKI